MPQNQTRSGVRLLLVENNNNVADIQLNEGELESFAELLRHWLVDQDSTFDHEEDLTRAMSLLYKHLPDEFSEALDELGAAKTAEGRIFRT